jgi:hypothetical protein
MLQLSEVRTFLGQLQATPRCMWYEGGHVHRDCPKKNKGKLNAPVLQLHCGTPQITAAAAMQKGKTPAEDLNEPLRRRLQLGGSSPPGTRPWHSPSQHQCAEVPSSPSWDSGRTARAGASASKICTAEPQAPCASGLPLDTMVRVTTAVQQDCDSG